MKHCFVINPAAGNGKVQKDILPDILEAAKGAGADYEIHRTSGPGEATIYVRDRVAAAPEEPVRFHVCGGDGTVAEVLNGLYGAKRAELAIVPAGSGNDYIRNFSGGAGFRDIAAQLAGEAAPVDVILYTYTPSDPKSGRTGEPVTSLALNMINMGFDAKVVDHMSNLKNKFFLKGTGAYIAGIVWELARYKMSRAVFRPDDMEPFETDILLASVGSGRFSGGGFDGIPQAVVNDGLLDLLVIEPISRGNFIRLVGMYHDGKHPGTPGLADKMRLLRVKEVKIEPVYGLVFTADGEVKYTERPLTVSLAPEKIRFVIPERKES